MTKDEDFKLLKIQTWVLKVNIHCDGCKHKVKKLLQKIEGVYTVNIDAENQKVSVSGTVDSATLIKKLVRSGKHAELWSQKGNQMQKSQPNFIRDEKNMKDQKLGLIKDLKNLKTQQKFQTFSSDEDDDDEDDDEEDDEEEFRFLKERAAKGLMRQINEVNAKKKNGVNCNVGVSSGNGNGGKKGSGNGGNQNQNSILKSPGGDQKTNIAANKNVSFAHGGGVFNNEGKQVHEMNGMGHGLGLHGLGFQAQHNNFQAPGFPQGYGNGYQHPSAMMNMNRQNMNDRYMQQMMYHNRSPVVPSNVGYHQYQPYPHLHPHPHHNQQYESVEYASHMFSDENTGSCSIM